MILWIEILFQLALDIAGAIAEARRRRRQRLAASDVWRRFAVQHGLAKRPNFFGRVPRVEGRIDGFHVTLESRAGGSGTRLRVAGRGAIPENLSITREAALDGVEKLLGGEDFETGDAALDRRARVRGDATTALALLSSENRRRLEIALDTKYSIIGGTIEWSSPEWVDEARRLDDRVSDALALAGALSIEKESIPARLLANVRGDEVERMRLLSLEALLEKYPARDETAEAARAALDDASETIRLAAAESLGDAGFETLATLVERGADPALRARALRAAATRREPERATGLVLSALDSPEIPLRVAALEIAVRLRLDDARVQSAAIALLVSDLDAATLAGARALEAVGGKRAVEPLLALERSTLPFSDRRAAAASALDAIRARLGPVEPGGLALDDSAAAAGGLSVLASEPGALALESPPPPRCGADPTAS